MSAQRQIRDSKFIRSPWVLPIARRVWKSRLAETLRRSHGDFRYPLFLVRWGLVKVLSPRKRVRVENVSFSIQCSNWITHFRWYLFKKKEPEVRHFFQKYLKENDVVFDVGANIGVFSLFVAALGRDSAVYAIEPEISNIARLRENILANGFQERIKPICAGVSDRVGITRLYLSSEEPGAAVHSISDSELEKTHLGYDVVGDAPVLSITLDYLSAELGVVPNLIKVDTDGNEKKILLGAKSLLAYPRLRAIIIEMPEETEQARQCRLILSEAGFVQSDYPYAQTLNEIWIRSKVSNLESESDLPG